MGLFGREVAQDGASLEKLELGMAWVAEGSLDGRVANALNSNIEGTVSSRDSGGKGAKGQKLNKRLHHGRKGGSNGVDEMCISVYRECRDEEWMGIRD